MTRTLVSLQRVHWARSIRANPAGLIFSILLALYVLVSLPVIGFVIYPAVQDGNSGTLAVLIALPIFIYLLMGALSPAGERQVWPSDLVILPTRPRDVRAGMLLISLMQIRPLIVVVAALSGAGIMVAASPVIVWVIVPMMAVSAFLCVLGVDAISAVLDSSKLKNILAIVGLIFFILGGLSYSYFSESIVDAIDTGKMDFGAWAQVIAWTPLGAPGAAIGAAAREDWAHVAGYAAISVISLGLLAWVWDRILVRRVDAPLPVASPGAARSKKQKGEASRSSEIALPGLPWGPMSVVYSRAIRYIPRDSRLQASLFLLPVVGIFFLVQVFIADDADFSLYIGAGVLAILGGSFALNDFGYDGPSMWLHMVSGIRVRALILARHAASISIGFIPFVAYLIALMVFADNKSYAGITAVIAGAAFIGACALSLCATIFVPYPMASPGTSPWNDRSGFSSAALLSTVVALIGVPLIVVPGGGLLVWGANAHKPLVAAIGAVLLYGIPIAIYLITAVFGVRSAERRLPEIFAKVRNWAS